MKEPKPKEKGLRRKRRVKGETDEIQENELYRYDDYLNSLDDVHTYLKRRLP